MTQPTNAQLFVAAGATLFGPHWTQPTAELLGWVLDERGQNRTVQRIKASAQRGEDYRINPNVWRSLADAARARADALATMAAALSEHADLVEHDQG